MLSVNINKLYLLYFLQKLNGHTKYGSDQDTYSDAVADIQPPHNNTNQTQNNSTKPKETGKFGNT